MEKLDKLIKEMLEHAETAGTVVDSGIPKNK